MQYIMALDHKIHLMYNSFIVNKEGAKYVSIFYSY